MTDNQILASTQRQAQLEAAKAAFFNSGGQITQARLRIQACVPGPLRQN